jgi:hypothetical protein
MIGQAKFTWNRLTGKKSRIIEYKGATSPEGKPA